MLNLHSKQALQAILIFAYHKLIDMKNLFLAVLLFIATISVAQSKLEPTDYDALVVFKITDDKGVAEENAVVTLINNVDKSVHVDTSDIDGNTEMLLKKGSSHTITVVKNTFKFDFGLFEVPQQKGKLALEENLQIKVITKYNRVYELKIHFAPNQAELYQAAKMEIDKLAEEMEKNPTMKIEVAGHTDNVGDDALNMRVSQKRAAVIKNYLVSKGIVIGRISAKGYGETSPVADNANEDGRNRNRRIEIKMF